jgi:hypothetical protein
MVGSGSGYSISSQFPACLERLKVECTPNIGLRMRNIRDFSETIQPFDG